MVLENRNVEVQMKTVKQVIAKVVKVECPYCGDELIEWLSDPRGTTDQCDSCGEKFKIAADAIVIIKN